MRRRCCKRIDKKDLPGERVLPHAHFGSTASALLIVNNPEGAFAQRALTSSEHTSFYIILVSFLEVVEAGVVF